MTPAEQRLSKAYSDLVPLVTEAAKAPIATEANLRSLAVKLDRIADAVSAAHVSVVEIFEERHYGGQVHDRVEDLLWGEDE